jgi:hypothetical protein
MTASPVRLSKPQAIKDGREAFLRVRKSLIWCKERSRSVVLVQQYKYTLAKYRPNKDIGIQYQSYTVHRWSAARRVLNFDTVSSSDICNADIMTCNLAAACLRASSSTCGSASRLRSSFTHNDIEPTRPFAEFRLKIFLLLSLCRINQGDV